MEEVFTLIALFVGGIYYSHKKSVDPHTSLFGVIIEVILAAIFWPFTLGYLEFTFYKNAKKKREDAETKP